MLLWLWIMGVVSHYFKGAIFGDRLSTQNYIFSCWICIQLCIWWKCAKIMVSLRVMARAKDRTPLLLTKSIESMKAALPLAKPFLCIPLPTASPPPTHCLIKLCEVDFIDVLPMRELILSSENLLQGPGPSKQQKWDMSPAPQEPCSQLQGCASSSALRAPPSQTSREKTQVCICSCPSPLSRIQGLSQLLGTGGPSQLPGSPVTSPPCSPAWLIQEEEIPLL